MSLASAVMDESVEFEAVVRSSGYAAGIASILKCFPNNQATIKRLLVASSKGDTETLYTSFESVRGSEDMSNSASGQQHLLFLLRFLFSISIRGKHQAFVEQLLKITPAPGVDLREFLYHSGSVVSPQPDSSPELWALMIDHGWRSREANKYSLNEPLLTLIHSDSKINISEIVVLILSYGVEVSIGHLRSALFRGDTRVRDLLFEKIDRKKLEDCRLLHDAIASSHIEMVEWLIDVAKMDVNIYPTEGPPTLDMFPGVSEEVNGTPLHSAIYGDKRAIARFLLSRGAKTNIKNQQGETAWKYAQRRRDWYMLGMMMFS